MAFPSYPKPLKRGLASNEPGFQSISGDDQSSSGSVAGSGTEVSGYVESPIEKRCGTCEYLENGNLCTQETVLKDPELKDSSDGLKIVDPKNGCCSFWEATLASDLHRQKEPQPVKPNLENVAAGNKRAAQPEGMNEKPPRVRLTFY